MFLLEPMWRAAPADAGVAASLGRALALDLRPGKAIAVLSAALKHAPPSPDVHAALAGLFAERAAYADAERHYARAVELNPAAPGVLLDWGHALRALGRLNDAAAAYKRAIALKPGLLAAHYGLCMLMKARKGDAAFESLEWAAVSQAHGPSDTSILHDILGKMHLDAGDGAAAFRHVEAANMIRALILERSGKGFDAAAAHRRTSAVIACAEKVLKEPPPRSAAPPRLLLLSGLPRSGKSLLEQRLARSPQVRTGGELSALRWMAHRLGLFQSNFAGAADIIAQAGPAKLAELRAQFYAEECGTGPEAFITDAGVGNTELLPLAPLFFPEAVLVHVGRDRADHAVAMYARPFGNAYYAFTMTPEGLRQALDEQDEILAACRRLNIAVHAVRFEEFLVDPAAVTNTVLQACGLEILPPNAEAALAQMPGTFGPVESLAVAARLDPEQARIARLYEPGIKDFLAAVGAAAPAPQGLSPSIETLWSQLGHRPLTVHDLSTFKQLERALAGSPAHEALARLHQRVAAVWARHAQAFGDFGLYYQSLDRVLLPGHRDTAARFAAYKLESLLVPGAKVLDVGCNTGFIGLMCATRGVRLEGFDIDPNLIDIARAVAEFLAIPAAFGVSDFRDFTPSAPPDLILSCAVHRWIGIPMTDYAAILRSWLTPGGHVLVESQGIRDPKRIEPDFDVRINEFAAAGFEALRSGEVCDDGISLRRFTLFRRLP